MSGLFISSAAEATRPGVFAVEIAPPRAVEGVSAGYIGFCGQFAWGPVQSVVTPTDPQNFFDLFEPAGSPRSSTGYRALMGRRKGAWKIVRVLASDAVAASLSRAGTGGNVVATAKYKGTLGNSITVQQADAASGLSGAKDFTVTLTDSTTGTTQETYVDVPVPTGGVAVTVDVSTSKLLASLVVEGALTAFPANATANLTSGSNGSAIAASDYDGTAGTADKGVALFELHADVRVVCHDDCGNTMRATVNGAFVSHTALMGDRIAMVDAATATAWSSIKASVTGAVVSDRAVFFGAWVQVRDDAGILRVSPFSTFAATAIVGQDPHRSHAQWADETTELYRAAEAVDASFSTASATVQTEATSLGVTLPIVLENGRIAALHDRTTSQTSGKKFTVRRRLTDFLAKSIRAALPSWVNGPNVASRWGEIKTVVDAFLADQVRKERLVSASTDVSQNNDASVGAGQFLLGIDAKTPAPMEKILLYLNAGEGVTVREAA